MVVWFVGIECGASVIAIPSRQFLPTIPAFPTAWQASFHGV